MKQLNKIYFFYFVFFVVILKFFNAPYNSYSILKSPYKERMTVAYGLCNNESWGFYNIIANNYDLKNNGTKYYDEPYLRFKGTKYEQETFFVKDPNENI